MIDEMLAAYAPSGVAGADNYTNWPRFSQRAYVSDTHGGRFVQNYANAAAAEAYGWFEDIGTMPVGGVLAKDSFVAMGNGGLAVGPLFMMEKMAAGFSADTGDWRYTMIMPDGSVAGQTGGAGSEVMQFCADCHGAVAEDQDHLWFLPEEFRVTAN